jgi:hypothetical protein
MFHYTDSRADVWLRNGYRIHQTPYGEGVSIEDVAGLDAAISRVLASLPLELTSAAGFRLELEWSERARVWFVCLAKVPNATTLKAMAEIERGEGLVQYRDLDDLFDHSTLI